MQNPSFYSVIIGTELLNGRREDSHFSFLNKELVNRGWEHKANLIIKDDPAFLQEIFELVKSNPNSVMFSFGGIGSTPDDFTREIASLVFTGVKPQIHNDAKNIIVDRLGDRAYPHPIKMAQIPKGSKLISNPVNNMPGFQLDDRFFFVPGFPQMAHPMINTVLDQFYPKNKEKFSCNFIAYTGENTMIEIMQELPDDIELSCLPAFMDKNTKSAEIYLSHKDRGYLEKECNIFKQKLKKINVEFKEL